MVNCAWKSRAASCMSLVIVPARNMMPRVSTVRWWTTGEPSGSASYTGSRTLPCRRITGRPATTRTGVFPLRRAITLPNVEALAERALAAAAEQTIAVPAERMTARLIRELASEALASRARLIETRPRAGGAARTPP